MFRRPIITEKTVRETKQSKFAFEVDRADTKEQIKRMAEKLFGVNVLGVQTVKIVGKPYRMGKRFRYGTKSDGKKAILKLKEGQKIDLFETQKN